MGDLGFERRPSPCRGAISERCPSFRARVSCAVVEASVAGRQPASTSCRTRRWREGRRASEVVAFAGAAATATAIDHAVEGEGHVSPGRMTSRTNGARPLVLTAYRHAPWLPTTIGRVMWPHAGPQRHEKANPARAGDAKPTGLEQGSRPGYRMDLCSASRGVQQASQTFGLVVRAVPARATAPIWHRGNRRAPLRGSRRIRGARDRPCRDHRRARTRCQRVGCVRHDAYVESFTAQRRAGQHRKGLGWGLRTLHGAAPLGWRRGWNASGAGEWQRVLQHDLEGPERRRTGIALGERDRYEHRNVLE